MNGSRFSVRVSIPLSVMTLLAMACGGGLVGDDQTAGSNLNQSGEAISGRKCPGSSTVEGIDVSAWQGSINWSSVKSSGKKFAIARVSDGLKNGEDSYFKRNWTGMKSAGLIRGAYQFFEPGQDATQQANMVVAAVGKLGSGDLPVMLDMEVTNGLSAATITARIHTWMNVITAGTGKKPLVYTGAYFWDDNVKSADFAGNPLVVAWYGTNCPGVPNAWASRGWTMHQYSSSGRVSGIGGNVDLDTYNGTLAELQALAGGSSGGSGGSDGNLAVSSGPLARNVNGKIEPILRGKDGALYHLWELDGSGWSAIASLGGDVPASSTPAIGHNPDGRLEGFVTAGNGLLYHSWQDTNFAWQPWSSLGGDFTGAVTVANNVNGILEIFARGKDGAIYHNWQGDFAGGWSGFQSLGGNFPEGVIPSVAKNPDGRLEVFVRGNDGALHHCWQTATFGWSAWDSLGGVIVGSVAAVRNVNDLIEVFASTASGRVFHIWEKVGGGWSDWAALSLTNSAGELPTATRNLDGRLELFTRGTDGHVWHVWQSTAFSWSDPQDMGGNIVGAPTSIANADGRIELLAVGAGGDLVHRYQTTAGGNWADWGSLGGSFTGW